jgi:hypothetical protein
MQIAALPGRRTKFLTGVVIGQRSRIGLMGSLQTANVG